MGQESNSNFKNQIEFFTKVLENVDSKAWNLWCMWKS